MAPLASTNTADQVNDDVRFEIRQYVPADRDQVLEIVGDGFLLFHPIGHPQHDFWAGYVKNSLKDVEDIPGSYLTPGSDFFVVTASSREGKGEPIVVGTTAVERKSDSVAELRRVSVKAEFRRFGIGRMLLNHIHEWAKNDESKPKYEKVVVSTASSYRHAVKFYESLGYEFTKTSWWSENPLIPITHLEKHL